MVDVGLIWQSEARVDPGYVLSGEDCGAPTADAMQSDEQADEEERSLAALDRKHAAFLHEFRSYLTATMQRRRTSVTQATRVLRR